MLRITKISIHGFKSFCDPVEIDFDQKGITAVVGPNGCGKSNIADALSWVIGEQKNKLLRSTKMEDVIFQGSRHRTSANSAEVKLTLLVQSDFTSVSAGKTGAPDSNTSEASSNKASLPKHQIFKTGDIITIGRRLYRNGNSEYEINNRICRLRDIQEIFAGTGLGGVHYAIIEQGRIGQILSAKPLERRAIIEEAAGITTFRVRQRAAELKLESGKTNLARVNDIITEVTRQHNSLKRQAARARTYQRLREEMRELTKVVLLHDYRTTINSLQSFQDKLKIYNDCISELSDSISSSQAFFTETRQKAESLETAINEMQNRFNQINLARERARQQEKYLQDKISAISSEKATRSAEIETARERSSFSEREKSRIIKELSETEEQLNTAAARLLEQETEADKHIRSDTEIQQTLNNLRQKAYENATIIERWHQIQQQLKDSEDKTSKQIQGLRTEFNRIRKQQEQSANQKSALKEKYETSSLLLNKLTVQAAEIRSKLTETTQARKAVRTNLSALKHQQMSLQFQLKTLNEINTSKVWFSDAVQELLRVASSPQYTDTPPNPVTPKFRVSGTVDDLINSSPEYDELIEVGLQDELQILIVPTAEDAIAAADYLETNNLGKATFLIAEDITTTQSGSAQPTAANEGNNHSLLHLLQLPVRISNALARVLPELDCTYIVDTTAAALTASATSPGQRFIARNGTSCKAGCLIKTGGKTDNKTGILSIKREISQRKAEIARITRQIELTEAEAAGIETQYLLQTTSLQDHEARIRVQENDLARLTQQIEFATQEEARNTSHLSLITTELKHAGTEIKELQVRLQQAIQASTDAREEKSRIDSEISSIQAFSASLRKKADEAGSSLLEQRTIIAGLSERRRSLQNDIQRLSKQSTELHKLVEQLEFANRQAEAEESNLRLKLQQTETDYQNNNSTCCSLSAQITLYSEDLNQLKHKLTGIETQASQLRNNLNETINEKGKCEIEIARITTHIDHIREKIHSESGLDPSELDPAHLEFKETDKDGRYQTLGSHYPDIDTCRTSLQALQQKIDEMGPVNLVALEELNQTSERLSFLETQKSDIEQAILDTRNAITELKSRTKEKFREAFSIINQNFSRTFQELFGGGHGEMKLIDETDLLETGIEIIARPPGKRLQNVLLLSGGEKAMTAIALIMSIFEFRPSPFCLLDEVDAPLDEVNISRFAEKITRMSYQTQFMIITHNKTTMEAAGTLYGVTMEDPGVSRLVSVRMS